MDDTTKELTEAFLNAQKEIKPAINDAKNTFFNGAKYASLGSVMEAVKEPLNKNGLFILHRMNKENELETSIIHSKSGKSFSSTIKLLLKNQDMQNLGSALTYAKRQNITSLLSLPTEDDDGNGASQAKKQDPPKIDTSEKIDAPKLSDHDKIIAYAKKLEISDMKLKELTIAKYNRPVDYNALGHTEAKSFCEYLKTESKKEKK